MTGESQKEGGRMKRFLPRLTYANAIASLALFIALGGAAVAAGLPKASVGKAQLKKGAVTSAALANKAVTAGKIGPKAVVAGKLGPNAVLPGNLGPGIIDSTKISASAVTAEKIKNNVVTTNKLNNGAVTSPKLATSAVGTTNIAENAITNPKIANATISKEKLASGVLGNVENLKSGQTERGVFSVGGTKEATKKASAFGSISFQQILAANPSVTVIVPKAGPYTTQCPGLGGGATTPEAVGGVACLYLTTEENVESLSQVSNRLGVMLTAKGREAAEGDFVASGVWAVTAP
jgi:hypothetical protein